MIQCNNYVTCMQSRAAIEARSGSDVYNLIGLFKEAEVEDLFDEKEFEGKTCSRVGAKIKFHADYS